MIGKSRDGARARAERPSDAKLAENRLFQDNLKAFEPGTVQRKTTDCCFGIGTAQWTKAATDKNGVPWYTGGGGR